MKYESMKEHRMEKEPKGMKKSSKGGGGFTAGPGKQLKSIAGKATK